jgi:signal transduction histidine kinase
VVARQQAHAGLSSIVEFLKPSEIFDEALRLNDPLLAESGIDVIVHDETDESLPLDRPRIVHVLGNLILNSIQAIHASPQASAELTLTASVLAVDADHRAPRLRITVQDTGEGIASEALSQLFTHGFTTRAGAHGFGLHSSALAAMEMGGKLSAHSDGPGTGARFTLEVPVRPSHRTSHGKAQ